MPRPPARPTNGSDGAEDIYVALERDLGLTREQAAAHGAQQERAITLDARLQRSLGDAYAGAWFDLSSGLLVVNVTDEGALEKAKAAGADARLVKHSLGELGGIKDELDKAAGATSSDVERRQGDEPRDLGLSAWTVDPVTNSVLVSVTAEQAGAAKELAAAYGDAVTVEEIAGGARDRRGLHGRRRRDQRRFVLGRVQPAQPLDWCRATC